MHPRRQAARIEQKTRISTAPTEAATFQSRNPPGLPPTPPTPTSTAAAAAAAATRTFLSELTPAQVEPIFQSTSHPAPITDSNNSSTTCASGIHSNEEYTN